MSLKQKHRMENKRPSRQGSSGVRNEHRWFMEQGAKMADQGSGVCWGIVAARLAMFGYIREN